MKKCVVIYNPKSGKKRKENFFDDIQKTLAKYNYDSKIIITEYAGHAEFLTETMEECDLLISIGGDGTFNEVMTGNFRREQMLLLAHIPLGTANDIGAMYGYGKNIINNLKLLMETGTIKKIDIPTINGRPFVYVAGYGKYTHVSYDTPRSLKEKYGYLAYIIRVLQVFKRKTTPLYDITYTVNNETYSNKCSLILISNATRIGGINNIYKDIKLDDDQFEVLLCTLKSEKELIKSLIDLNNKGIYNKKGFIFYRTNKLDIKFHGDDLAYWCIDGDKLDELNSEYEIINHKNIKIMLPKKNTDKLFSK